MNWNDVPVQMRQAVIDSFAAAHAEGMRDSGANADADKLVWLAEFQAACDSAIAHLAELGGLTADPGKPLDDTLTITKGIGKYGDLRSVSLELDGKDIGGGEFGGEPEDNSAERDYRWVVPAFEKLATQAGLTVSVVEFKDDF